MAPLTGTAPPLVAKPATNDQAETKPAPTGGLLRSGAQATGSATRGLLNGLFAAIHNALARKV